MLNNKLCTGMNRFTNDTICVIELSECNEKAFDAFLSELFSRIVRYAMRIHSHGQ